MRKLFLLIFTLYTSILIYGEVKVAIHEPIRFKNINTKAYGDLIVGEGALEIFSTKIEEDSGKKIEFHFPEKVLMTNKKRWIEIDRFKIPRADEKFILKEEKKIVKLYAFIKRRDINKNEKDGSLVEGEYVGKIPIIVKVYGKPINSPKEDIPTVLPSFPDEDIKPVPLRKKGV